MERRQLKSIFIDAFDDEINHLFGVYNYHDYFIFLTNELKWKPNENIGGQIYWSTIGYIKEA